MIQRPAFRRASAALTHPAAIASVILLLVNDHILRRVWPSGITGKLGDVAWLIFAPLVLAVLLALLIPGRTHRHEPLVGGLAFGLTALIFAAGNTLPAVNNLVIRTIETLTGSSASLVCDPTDLLTLPALLLGWLIWQQAAVPRTRRAWQVSPVIVLAALATLANTSAPDYGIDCFIQQEDGSLIAVASHSWQADSYISTDGGQSWEFQEPVEIHPDTSACDIGHGEGESWTLSAGDQVQYRFTPGQAIERSDDGGQRWEREFTLRGSEARAVYYLNNRSGAWDPRPGPLDALVLPDGETVVAAMGQDGVLLRAADGDWQWVTVGPYYREQMGAVETVWQLTMSEMALALSLIFLMFGSLALFAAGRRTIHTIAIILVALFWLAVAVGLAIFKKAMYMEVFMVMGSVAAIPLALVVMIMGIVRLIRNGKTSAILLLMIVAAAVISAVLFIVPYILWVVGGLQHYWLALIFALLLTAATTTAALIVTRRIAGPVEAPAGEENASA